MRDPAYTSAPVYDATGWHAPKNMTSGQPAIQKPVPQCGRHPRGRTNVPEKRLRCEIAHVGSPDPVSLARHWSGEVNAGPAEARSDAGILRCGGGGGGRMPSAVP
jgi:hypothetical protein